MQIPESMLRVYMSRRETDLETLRMALRANRLDDFHRIGHNIAGNARNFGLLALEAIGQEMESLAAPDLPTEGARLLSKFSEFLRQQKS